MSFTNQPTWGINYYSSTIGVISFVDELTGFTLLTELYGLVGDELIGAEAVVELDDANLLGGDAGVLVDFADNDR